MTPPKLTDNQIALTNLNYPHPQGFARAIADLVNQQWQEMLAGSEPVAWMTNESKRRLKRGGNGKGAVPVHMKPSSVSCIPLFAHPAPDHTAVMQQALEALELIVQWDDADLALTESLVYKASAAIAALKQAPGEQPQPTPTQYSLHITDPREFAKELARYMRRADAPLSDHQVITLFHYLEAMSTPDGEQGAST